jgi:hypothetical protein
MLFGENRGSGKTFGPDKIAALLLAFSSRHLDHQKIVILTTKKKIRNNS